MDDSIDEDGDDEDSMDHSISLEGMFCRKNVIIIAEENPRSQDDMTELLSSVPTDDEKLLDSTSQHVIEASDSNSDSDGNSNEGNSGGNYH